jgi:hypothetical protein
VTREYKVLKGGKDAKDLKDGKEIRASKVFKDLLHGLLVC